MANRKKKWAENVTKEKTPARTVRTDPVIMNSMISAFLS